MMLFLFVHARLSQLVSLYNMQWTAQPIKIKLDTDAFAKGGLRVVYHMQVGELSPDISGHFLLLINV